MINTTWKQIVVIICPLHKVNKTFIEMQSSAAGRIRRSYATTFTQYHESNKMYEVANRPTVGRLVHGLATSRPTVLTPSCWLVAAGRVALTSFNWQT